MCGVDVSEEMLVFAKGGLWGPEEEREREVRETEGRGFIHLGWKGFPGGTQDCSGSRGISGWPQGREEDDRRKGPGEQASAKEE